MFFSSKYQIGILILFTILLNINTLQHGYVLDDAIVITNNIHVQNGIHGLSDIFTKDSFHGFFQDESKAHLVSGGRYRPWSLAVFALWHHVFGDQPMSYHILSILLYAFVGALVYLLTRELFKTKKIDDFAIKALYTAALFIAHPIHTEVVANIKGQDELWAAAGALITLLIGLKFIQSGKRVFLVAVAFSFFIALLSKEHVIMFTMIGPITWYLMDQHKPWESRRQIWLILTIGVVAVSYLFVRSRVLGWTVDAPPMELMNNPFLKYVDGVLQPFTATERWSSIGQGWYTYFKLIIWPHPLCHDYYPRSFEVVNWTDIRSLIGWSSLFVVSAIGIYGTLIKKRLAAYGALFFVLILMLTSNMLFPVGTHVSERFLFLPSVGFCLVVVALLMKYLHKKWIYIFLSVITLVFSICTVLRNPVWKDNFTLFQHDVMANPKSAKLQNAAAGSLLKAQLGMKGKEQQTAIKKALKHSDHAIRIHPRYKNAHLLKGNAHLYLREYNKAISAYRQALLLDPQYADALQNLRIGLKAAGRHSGEKQGDLRKAIAYLEEAVKLDPNDVEANRLLGVAYGHSGDHLRAIQIFKRLTELYPNEENYWRQLATAYHLLGQSEERDLANQKANTLSSN